MTPRCSGYPVVPDEIHEKWPSGIARLNLIFIHATYDQLNGMRGVPGHPPGPRPPKRNPTPRRRAYPTTAYPNGVGGRSIDLVIAGVALHTTSHNPKGFPTRKHIDARDVSSLVEACLTASVPQPLLDGQHHGFNNVAKHTPKLVVRSDSEPNAKP